MEKVIGYQYNSITNEFTYQVELQKDPIESKIIMPSNCTTLKPMQCNDNEIPIYNKSRNKWESITDYRGIWYDKNTGIEKKLETIYDTSLSTPITFEEELKKKQKYKYDLGILTLLDGTELVKENPNNIGVPFDLLEWNFYEKRFDFKKDMTNIKNTLKNGYRREFEKKKNEDIEYKDTLFQADDKTINTMQQFLLYIEEECDITWLDSNNEPAKFKKIDLQNIAKLVLLRNENLFKIFQNIKTDILNCKDYNELNAIIPEWKECLTEEDKYKIFFDKYIQKGDKNE